ncbi:MAG: DNA recombination/repair protein RecA [Candidatus Omnitrophica bacterium]|nr:DNA recombination/repair protein RecA [Candidatus Omnitrophota bacterium]
MKRKRTNRVQLNEHEQIKNHINSPIKKKKKYDGSIKTVVSTGSTLLDLAISGGRVRGGGIPLGILVELFGPTGAGKTVLLCEIAGDVQRKEGDIMFHDPEARLNKQFAQMFDVDFEQIDYTTPDTVTEVFQTVRNWQPKGNIVNGIFADSLAALSTDMEMENKEGDKMGMRRAKEFSEELRKTCRIIAKNNWLMVCSNQVRQNLDAGQYGQKYTTPGGLGVGFYSSLRLRAGNPEKIWVKQKIVGKETKRCIGVETQVEVFKSSIWKPFHTAPVIILFDYGIDDIRANLQFIKDFTKNTMYTIKDNKLDMSMEKSISIIEKSGAENDLRNQVIDLWEEIEQKFKTERKPKQR